MRNLLLTWALTLAIWIASETMVGAQVYVEYRSSTANRSLRITYSSGWACGVVPWGWGNSLYRLSNYGTLPRVPYYPYYVGHRIVTDYAPVYLVSPVSAERANRLRMHEDVEEGIRRFRAADYRGAVDAFRKAFLVSTDEGLLQLWLGLALAGSGDFRNAEKAIRGAFETLNPAEGLGIDLPASFRDPSEESRFLGMLAKNPWLAGVTAFLMGRKDEARRELEKLPQDAVTRKLLDPLSK